MGDAPGLAPDTMPTAGSIRHPFRRFVPAGLAVAAAGAAMVALATQATDEVLDLLGLGGLVAGTGLTFVGGLAAIRSAGLIVTEGLQLSGGDGLMSWTFLLVYGSWFATGLAVIAASWRYWAHRRDACPACGPLLESQRTDDVPGRSAARWRG